MSYATARGSLASPAITQAQHQSMSSALRKGAGTHSQGDIMLHLDPDSLLAIEVTALAILVALGIWRIAREPEGRNSKDIVEPPYDMRRDGQQLTN
ncbi:MAG: hypothetical protein ABIO63_08430 [Casimicrobiaceae bacterium]